MRVSRWLLVLLGCVALVGCPASSVRQEPGVTQATLSLRKLTCQGCGARVVRVLKRQKGVRKVSFDKHKVELQVAYQKAQITEAAVIQKIEKMGFTALRGSGRGAYKPPVKFEAAMDVKWIAKRGEAVALKEHLAANKVTVFDFYADWCGPCKDVDHALLKLLKKYPDKVALRKINVIDWNRPVVKQHMSGVSQLPYLIIFDGKGRKAQVIVGRKLKLLRATIQKLSGAIGS